MAQISLKGLLVNLQLAAIEAGIKFLGNTINSLVNKKEKHKETLEKINKEDESAQK